MLSAWLFVYLAARLAVAALFLASALHKGKNLKALGPLVRELAPFVGRAARPLGATALCLEVSVVIAMLLGGKWAFSGLLAAIAVVGLYTGLQISAVTSNRKVVCDCFELPGQSEAAVSVTTVIRNVLIMGVIMLGIVAYINVELLAARSEVQLWIQAAGMVVGVATAGGIAWLGRPKVFGKHKSA